MGTPGLQAGGKLGPGEPASQAFLRKVRVLNDLTPTVCTKLLTIELSLTRSLELKQRTGWIDCP
jgi:hypothetical protein